MMPRLYHYSFVLLAIDMKQAFLFFLPLEFVAFSAAVRGVWACVLSKSCAAIKKLTYHFNSFFFNYFSFDRGHH